MGLGNVRLKGHGSMSSCYISSLKSGTTFAHTELRAIIPVLNSNPTACGEIHEAARDGDLQKVKALLKDNPELIVSVDRGCQTPL